MGGILALFGAVIAAGSFLMQTAAPTEIGLTMSPILNLGLLQTQMMVFHSGLAVLLVGVLLTVAPQRSEAERSATPLGSGGYLLAVIAAIGLAAMSVFVGANSHSDVQLKNGVYWRPGPNSQ